MEVVLNEVVDTVKYGNIIIKTRIGDLRYSYRLGSQNHDDDNYQLETVLSDYHLLTSEELDEIDDLITRELYYPIK